MAYRDLYSEIRAISAIVPGTQTVSPVNGATLDMQPNKRLCFVVQTGTLSGGATYNARIQESDNGTTWADVPAGFVDSNAPASLTANGQWRLGYRGSKRYVRLQMNNPAAVGQLSMSAVAIVEPIDKPVL